MSGFGRPTPRTLSTAASVPTFPQTDGTWTHPTGAITVPAGTLDRWFAYRQTLAATRGEVICIGDSTTYGSGALYSWCQRMRDNAVGFGMLDGGKGMFGSGEGTPGGGPIAYDSLEINGYVSATGFAPAPDSADVLDGQFWFDAGGTPNTTVTLQFRQTCARLWYSSRATAGDFTYSIDGGGAATVKAYQASGSFSKYVYISGLAANTTHTLTITNLATSTNGGPATNAGCWVALSPMNATGIVFQKFGTSGDTISTRLYSGSAASPWTQTITLDHIHQSFGLVPTAVSSPTYTGATVDTSYAAGARVNPVLGILHLGFNDLTADGAGALSDLALWTEAVKRFAGICSDAGCPGIVCSGQLPYNQYWPTIGAARFNAMKSQALASNLLFVDLFYPVGGPSLSYVGGTSQPHLSKAQYQAQADFLWNNLLGLTD